MKYNLKQADEKQEFTTGAQRDSQKGKSRPDLISPVFLDRLGTLLTKGAEHYGERNWEKGMPLSRVLASGMRHMVQLEDGQEDEDHAIQVAFAMMVYVHTQHRIRAGLLPAELDDMPHEKNLTAALTSTQKLPTIERELEKMAYCCKMCYYQTPIGHRVTCKLCNKELDYEKC